MEQTEASIISRHIEEKLSAYWHDVDFNWGRNAGAHYTEDGVFEGTTIRYENRKEIETFYNWRQERGERVNVHLVGNFYSKLVSDSKAEVSWICTLFAHDGDAPQPSAPPIAISRVADIFVKEEDGE